MQPEFSSTPRTGEQTPSNNVEAGYNGPPGYALPEVSPERSFEQGYEHSPMEVAPAQPVQPLPQQAVPSFGPLPATSDTMSSMANDNPISANDDDTIEKEWVNRAKQILAQTRDDPYAREKAINELQRDYLMKRYGKQLGAVAD